LINQKIYRIFSNTTQYDYIAWYLKTAQKRLKALSDKCFSVFFAFFSKYPVTIVGEALKTVRLRRARLIL